MISKGVAVVCLSLAALGMVQSSVFATSSTNHDEDQYSLALEKNFSSIRLDEKDLARLSEIISELPKHYGGHLEIQVTSADGQETVKTATSYAFFLTPDMPRVICCIQISYSNVEPHVSFYLKIGSRVSGAVTLSAEGTDAAVVAGVFREVERELEAHPAQMRWFHTETYSLGTAIALLAITFIVLATLSAVACIALLYFLEKVGVPYVKIATTTNEPLGIAGTLAILSFFLGGIALYTFLRDCFPTAQFTGQLSDPGTYARSWLIWIVVSTLLPMALAMAQDVWRKSTRRLTAPSDQKA